jgi:hypothetical protein
LLHFCGGFFGRRGGVFRCVRFLWSFCGGGLLSSLFLLLLELRYLFKRVSAVILIPSRVIRMSVFQAYSFLRSSQLLGLDALLLIRHRV